jgi:hypothetical protein
MTTLKTLATAFAFSLAGVLVHANAADLNRSGGAPCFQLTPLADKGALPQIAADGFSRTPLGMRVDSAPPAQQTLAADGYSRTPLGKRLASEQESGVA